MKNYIDLFGKIKIPRMKKIFRIMRLISFFLMISVINVFASKTYSQTKTLNVNLKNATVKEVLAVLEDQSEFYFMYSGKVIDVNREVSVDVKNKKIDEILDMVFANSDVDYTIKDRIIVLTTAEVLNSASLAEFQQKSVSGKVTDSDGQPLPGVTVILKGTSQGNVTNTEGDYSLANIPENATLVFSFVGMRTQEVVVGSQASINVKMVEETIGIEEVVTIGYGTQKKINVVGSMASISGEEISKMSTTNFAENLQGRASGLSVTNTSGHPGSAPDIKIRGLNSISLSTSPLWIVDGMPIYTDPSENTRDGVKGVSAIAMINPNDIKSIEILKDAAATAIYGSRASGGVILVTTKSAEKGMPNMSISYDGGFSQIPFSQNDIFVDSPTYWKLSDLMAENLGIIPADPNSIINTKIMGDKPSMTKEEAIATNTDHLGSFTRVASFHQFGLTASKSLNTGGVMFSLNYRDEKGLIENNDLNRLTSRFSFNFKPVESIEMGISSNLIYLKTNGVRSQGGKSFGGWANWAYTLPWMKVYDPDSPTGYWAAASGYNMRANVDRKLQRYDVDEYRAINNAYAQWSPIEGLKVKGEVGVDLIVSNSSFWRSQELKPYAPFLSYAEEQSVTKYVANYDVYANYNKTFNEIHNVDFTIGTEANRNWSYTRTFSGAGLQTAYPELINPLQMTAMKGYQGGDIYMLGFFARGNYKLSDRYLIDVSVRRDGHSAFSEENRWANFYAVGAGWILTNENFMKDLPLFSLLKLRGSYGITGNTRVSNTMTYMQWGLDTHWNFGSDVSAGSTTIGPLGSANLKWETTANTDIGIDFGMLKNRINGSFAFYTQKIKDLILLGSVQPSVGFDSNYIYENAGDMNNQGFEFNVSTTNILKKDFIWKTDFNISTNKNKIISLNETEKGKGKIEDTTIRKEGEALNTYFLANYTNVDVEKGIPMIETRDADVWANEDKTVSTGAVIPATASNVSNNRMIQHGKTSLPTYYGGLNNTFTYKNFDLNILLYFEGGHWLWNDLYANGWTVGVDSNTIKEIWGNTWEKPGDVAEWPQLLDGTGIYYDNEGNPTATKYTINFNQTTRFLERGDFLRVRNIQLGYTLPKYIVNKIGVGSVRFYVGANNLYTITGYKGLDPESLNDLPIPRTVNFGISLNL